MGAARSVRAAYRIANATATDRLRPPIRAGLLLRMLVLRTVPPSAVDAGVALSVGCTGGRRTVSVYLDRRRLSHAPDIARQLGSRALRPQPPALYSPLTLRSTAEPSLWDPSHVRLCVLECVHPHIRVVFTSECAEKRGGLSKPQHAERFVRKTKPEEAPSPLETPEIIEAFVLPPTAEA